MYAMLYPAETRHKSQATKPHIEDLGLRCTTTHLAATHKVSVEVSADSVSSRCTQQYL